MTLPETQAKPIGWIVAAAAAAAAAAIFVLDMVTPIGISVPMLYGIPLLMTWFVPGLWSTFLLIGIAMALTWGGTALSSGELTADVAVNRIMASALLLAIGWLVIKRKRLAKQRDADQAALRESEERFRMLAETMPHIVWQTDNQGEAEFENQRWYDYTGLTHETTGRGGWLTVQHPDDAPQLADAWKRAVETGGDYDAETRFRCAADGTYRWFRVRGAPVRDAEGRIQAWVGTCTDIHDRKEAEMALRQSEERLRLFVEYAPAAIAMFDKEMKYLAVSRRFLDDYHVTEPFVIGRSHYDVFPDIPDRWREYHRRGLQGEVLQAQEDRFERADGTTQWLHWEIHPWHGRGGEVDGILIFAEEITERKLAEQALRESEARFRTMAEAVPSFLFETDAEGWNIWTSEGWCRFTGQTPEQVAGHGWAEALHPDDRAANIDRWMQCLKDGVPFESQQRLRRNDGTYVWVIARALPVRDREGKLTRWVGSVTNVDDIVRVQEALRESEERFAKAFRASPHPIGITEVATGRCIEVNEACLQLFGFRREEVIGNTTLMLGIWPNQKDRAKLVERLKAGEPVHNLEASFKTKSGDLRHILVSSDLAELGGTLCLITIGNDITERKQAEQAIKSSEEWLRAIMNSLTNHIAVLDSQGVIVAVNEAWSQFAMANNLQRSPAEWIGVNYFDVCREAASHDETARDALQGLEEVCAGVRPSFQSEYPCHSETERRWFILRATPLSGTKGRVVVSHENITDLRLVQESLRIANATLEQRVRERTVQLAEANERWGWVVRATNDAVWDWDLVRDTAYFSPRWKEMHGFQDADQLESVKEWSARIHPEDRPRVMERLEEYFSGKRGEFWEEYRIQRKDGTYFWVLDRGVAIFNEQGQAVRMVGAETDITWRKGVEQALRFREQQFHTLADNVPAHFAYIDRSRRYQFLNKHCEVLFQRPAAALQGMSVQDLLGPEDYARLKPFLDQALAGEPVSFEYTRQLPGDGTCYLSGQYVPDRDDQGNVRGVLALMTDITRLKSNEALLRAREAQLRELGAKLLRAQEEERRRISRDLHDDVMQRMGALTLELYGLASSTSSQDEELQSRLKAFGASAEQLTTDLQRMAHQLHPAVLEFGGLETAVREQVNDFGARTGVSAEFIAKDVPKDIPLDQATCLYRVLQEGLQNVQKHAEATTVLVRLMKTGRGLGLCIHDDGRGVEKNDETSGRRGLGLTSMAERVGMLKGVFRIKAKPGDGTELHAWVPLEEVKRET